MERMKPHDNDSMDRLSERFFRESSLESPSPDFTARVMDRIEGSTDSSVFRYRPLMNRRAWAAAVAFLVVLFAGAAFFFSPDNPPVIDVSSWNIYNIVPDVSSKIISNSLVGIFFLSVFILAQIIIYKYYFQRRPGY